jgi:hypothetical protein
MAALLWTIILLGAGLWIVSKFWWPQLALPTLPTPKVEERITLSVLRSETLSFLVTRRTVTQIVVDHEQSSWLGEWRGALWATVDFRYGVDLQKLTDADVHQEGNVVTVHLPDPELLDFGIRPGTIGMLTKSTASAKLEDLLHNGHRKELERRLQSQAIAFACQQGLMPSRKEIVRQLNDTVALLRGRTGIEFRFE